MSLTSSVKNPPMAVLATALILTGGALLFLGGNSFRVYVDVKKTIGQVVRLEELRGTIRHLDEVLTMSARMATTTGDTSWETRYFQFEPELDAAIVEAMTLVGDSRQQITQTDAANRKLVEMEKRALELVRMGHVDEARSLLFSDTYERQKHIYSDGLKEFEVALSNLIAHKLDDNRQQVFWNGVALALLIPLLIVSWVVMIRAVRRWQANLSETNHRLNRQTQDLEELTRQLDRRVAARTQELETVGVALERSQAFLNATGKMAKVGGWELIADTLEIRWTEETYRIHEVPLDDQPPMEKALSFYHPDDRPQLETAIQQAIEHGKPYDMEIRFITAKGRPLWVQTICQPIMVNGKTVTLTGTLQDVTERKQVEKTLRESERKLRTWLEKSPVCTKMVDLNFNLQYMSAAGIDGLRISDVTPYYGKPFPFADFYRKPFRDQITKSLKRVKETGESTTQEVAAVNTDGDTIWFQTTFSPVNDDNGQIEYIIVVSQDITERKRSEIFQSEQRRVLELISQGKASQIEIFEAIINIAETHIPSIRGSLLLVDGHTLRFGAAPSMPDAYNALIDGLPIGPAVGSCGTAVYCKARVVVEDVRTDPLWGDFHHLGEQYGFQACWSQPILDGDDNVLGTFALYHEKSGGPGDAEIQVIESLAHLAGITIERKKMEEARRDNEERLHAIYNQSHDAIFLWDLEHDRILDFNLAAMTLLEYSPQELRDTPISMIYPREMDRLKDFTQSVREQGGKRTGELSCLTKNGSLISTELSASYIEIKGKSYLLALVRNISERKQAEQTLRESEERYRLVLEAVPSGMIVTDKNGIITLVNRVTESIFGYTRQQLIGQTIERLVPERFRAQHLKHRTSYSTAPTPRPMGFSPDLFGLRQDGFEFPVEIRLDPIHTPDGPFVLATITDITERKQTEATLRANEERLHAIYDQSNDAIFLLDLDHDRILDCNQAAVTLLGYSFQELTSLPISGIHPYDMEIFQAFAQSIREQGGGKTGQLMCLTKNHVRVPVEISASFVVIKGNNYLVALMRDITERIQSETQLKESEAKYRKLNEELEHRVDRRTQDLVAANKELKAFGYSISHDLRGPLRAIHGFGKALLEDYGAQLPTEGQRYLGLIRNEAVHMGRLIDSLLTLSRLGWKTLEIKTIDMAALTRKTFEEVKTQNPDQPAQLTMGALPPTSGDWNLIHQVWTNLLANALKFTPPGTTTLIDVNAQIHDSEVIYSIKDHGAGFDMAYADKLFGVFQRLHSQEEFEGTGVGLAIVQRIIHRHGGRIWAEGKINEGATFYFTLPSSE